MSLIFSIVKSEAANALVDLAWENGKEPRLMKDAIYNESNIGRVKVTGKEEKTLPVTEFRGASGDFQLHFKTTKELTKGSSDTVPVLISGRTPTPTDNSDKVTVTVNAMSIQTS